MMKKLLLGFSTLLLACFSAKAQISSTASVSIAPTPDISTIIFTPGEPFSFDVLYEAEVLNSEELFFQVIFGEANGTGDGITFATGTFDAAASWGAVGANLDDTGFLQETRTLAASVPAGIMPSSAFTNGVGVCVRVKAAGDVTLSEACSVIDVQANAISGDLTDVVWTPSSVEAGEDLTLDLNYTSSVPTDDVTNEITAIVYITDAGGKYEDANVPTYALFESDLPTTTTSIAKNYTYSIPASLTPSADLPEGDYYRIDLVAFGKQYRDSINIVGPSSIITMDTASLVNPATAEIGDPITIEFNYSHNYATEQDVVVSLVVADKTTGEFITFPEGPRVPAGGWLTAGFVPATTIVSSETDVSFPYTISSEAIASTELEANEEWRLYIKLGDGDVELKNSDAPVIEITQTAVQDKIVIDAVSYTAASAGDSILVEFSYSSKLDAEVELTIFEYLSDGFTVAPGVDSVAQSVFVVNLAATTVPGELSSGSDRIAVLAGTTLSADLTGGNQYMVVAKLLDATTNGFLEQTQSSILVVEPEDVIGLGDKATVATFTLFPNPSNGVVNFSQEVSNVVVYDATGNIVITEASATSLNTASLEAGIYMINTDQGSTKFIVE